jgi:hypothetical protein
MRMLYSMMGVIRGGRVFLSFPVEEGYSLLILRRENQGLPGETLEQRQGLIQVDKGELYLNSFDLSNNGILSALLVSDYEAKLVWWRTDKIVMEGGF